jgi:hypothetical protein
MLLRSTRHVEASQPVCTQEPWSDVRQSVTSVKEKEVSFHYSLFAFLSIMPDPRDFLIVQANEACKSTISRLANEALSPSFCRRVNPHNNLRGKRATRE